MVCSKIEPLAYPSRIRDQASIFRERLVASLQSGAHIHIIGVCGTGTAAVLSLLKQLGFFVTGSDKAFYPPMSTLVRSLADRVFEGYSTENLVPLPSLVVIGNSLSRGNPEVEFVLEHQLPFASMPEVLGALLVGTREDCRTSIVVAGTHGKTTTTAAIATMLETSGCQPGYFIGGMPKNLPSNICPVDKNLPANKRVAVLEGDEYDSAFFAKWPKFHSYRPDVVIMTSLEFDHADIYNNVEEIDTEFIRLAKRVPEDGALIVCGEENRLLDLALSSFVPQHGVNTKVYFYGEKTSYPFYLLNRSIEKNQEGNKQLLDLSLQGQILSIQTPLSGKHNALNLLAAAATGSLYGLSSQQIQEGLEKFTGVLKRQNVVLEHHQILIIEDFAHHPTAIRVTLEGLKEKYPNRRLIAIFEPRSNTSRRGFFYDAYKTCFQSADQIVILEVVTPVTYSNTTAPIVSLDVKQLVKDLNTSALSSKAFSFPSIDEIQQFLLDQFIPRDVLVFMSNGDFGGIVSMFVNAWSKTHLTSIQKP